jgi:peptide/nickel transport system substrate-binding protein
MKKAILMAVMVGLTSLAIVLTAQAAGEKPKYGGSIRIGYAYEPSSLDPLQMVSGGDQLYIFPVFDFLVNIDSNCRPAMDTSLAERVEYPDEKTIVFHLRKGVKFQDGTDFNAAAVKAHFDRVLDPNFKGGFVVSILHAVKNVEVVDNQTVKLNLKNPDPSFVAGFDSGSGMISSPAAIKKMGDADYSFNPVGTGSFKFKEFVPASHVTLVKNEGYWRKDAAGNRLPYLDSIQVRLIKEEAIRSAALESGQIDMAFIPVSDVDRFQAKKGITVHSFIGASPTALLIFNRTLPPMDNVNLRRAVAYACDPVAINKGAYYGKAMVAKGGMCPPGSWAYDPTIERPYYNIKKAKEFLKLGGKPNGFTMDVISVARPDATRTAEIIKDQLSKIGITINIKTYDVGTATKNFFQENGSPMYVTNWSRRTEPNIIAGYAYTSDGFFNPGRPKNPEMDALITKGATTNDLNKRKEIYRQIDKTVLQDCWYVPLLYESSFLGAWNYVKGVSFGCDAKLRPQNLWISK